MKRKITAIFLVVALALALVVPAAPVAASPDSIVGLWHFDGDADDDSGNGYNGTLHGDATYVDVESEMPGFDRALSLDGNGDYVEVAHAIAVTSAITMEAWVKVDAPISADAEVISKWDGSGNGVIHFEIAPDLKVRMCLRHGTGINDYIVNFYSTEALLSDQWVHVAEVWDGTTATIYFDGVAKGSQSGSGTIRHNSSMKYWIGSAYGTMRFFDGLIDEVRIWDEALSAGQIGDVSAPVVSITTPAAGCYTLASLPSLTYTINDANSYTDVVTGWSTVEGTHTVTVTATDVLGYVGSASVTYTVDNTDPVVTITAPEDGAFYLVGMVPAGAYTVDETNPYTVVESGWSDDAGMHTYTVTATDCAGNVGSASVTYYVVDSYGTIGGQITQEDGSKKKDWAKISYGGWAGLAGATEYGELEVTFHNVNNPDLDKTKFVATSIDVITFTNTLWGDADELPAPPYSDYGKVIIEATGDLVDANTLEVISANCTIKIQAADRGEPGHPATAGVADSIRIELNCDGTTYDYDSSLLGGGDFEYDGPDAGSGYRHYIDAGNIQVVKVD